MDYNWSQLEEIFFECLKIPASERKDYISKQAGGNQALKETLLSMLANAGDEEKFFNNLQGGIANALSTRSNLEIFSEGDILGKYKIQSLLDKGGMGQVYLAHRNDGQYEQKVAIKCFSNPELKHQYLQNFRQEQQFLASLNHPNIVHILDAGLTEQGIAYIIMDYVEGLSIDKYFEQNPQTSKEKLLVFLKVCETIQFAHSQLILHLDIKPNNILIKKEGDIKLLDFGIAQKVGHLSQGSSFIATPGYASPEQLQQKNISVTSDIYQLGILLHIILTNKMPFKKDEEAIESRKPEIDWKKIDPELISIIERCLKDKPEARYQSVNQLISEVDNYLKGFPVKDYSNSWPYRTSKYIKRNKLTSGLLVLLFFSLLIGILVSNYQAKLARKQTTIAELSAEKSERISEFLISIFESANPELSGTDKISVEKVLAESVNKIQFYSDDPLKAELLLVLGTTYSKIGNYNAADTLLSQAISLFQKGYFTEMENFLLAYYELSKSQMYNSLLKESIHTAETGIALASSLRREPSSALGLLHLQYALANMEAGNIAGADSVFNISLPLFKNHFNASQLAEAYNVKGSIANYKGLTDSSIHYLTTALSLLKNSTDQVFYLTVSENLASCYRQNNEPEKALAIKKETIEITKEIYGTHHLEYIKSANGLGLIYKDIDSLELAHLYLSEAVKLTVELLGEKTLAYVSSAGNLALVFFKMEMYDEAEHLAEKANTNALLLGGKKHPFYLWSLGIYAEALYKNNKLAKARAAFVKALSLQKSVLGEDHPWYQKANKIYNEMLQN
ncbi:hypothetical protein GCM10011506_27640 [Marivirga lumbricoides]|uniref:Protein kinase domain-containing protein n=1 Tax=Marivirga lumbricoides TaxID=1046115 RepID=A0ABQ1MGR6_9BACT|nr:hypothetical protein GCM10011506_27640 [Marivirga lumbricoides]